MVSCPLGLGDISSWHFFSWVGVFMGSLETHSWDTLAINLWGTVPSSSSRPQSLSASVPRRTFHSWDLQDCIPAWDSTVGLWSHQRAGPVVPRCSPWSAGTATLVCLGLCQTPDHYAQSACDVGLWVRLDLAQGEGTPLPIPWRVRDSSKPLAIKLPWKIIS